MRNESHSKKFIQLIMINRVIKQYGKKLESDLIGEITVQRLIA